MESKEQKGLMLKRRGIIIVALVLYTLIIFLPPLVHGYVYPNNGDDTAFHLAYFDTIRSGDGGVAQYLGQNIIGYPLVWASDFVGVSIDTLFLWFNFLVLWLVGIMAFIIVAKFIDWRMGLLAIPMVMFMTPSTLNLYDTGAIYDLVTVGIALPATMYCAVKLWSTKKWLWFIPLALGLVAVVLVHTMALWSAMGSDTAERQVPTLAEFASIFLGYAIVLILVAAVVWAFPFKALRIGKETKVLLVCLTAIVTTLVVLMLTGVMGWSLRIALDAAIVFPLLVACLLGVVIKNNKSRLVWGIVCFFVLVASIPIISMYVQYNSAIKPLDMEAIRYVNSLEGEYYSCSPEVAPWIYGRFLDKEYKEGELPHISRSEPMTSRTSPDSLAYWWENSNAGYYRDYAVKYANPDGNVAVFKDGELKIEVVY